MTTSSIDNCPNFTCFLQYLKIYVLISRKDENSLSFKIDLLLGTSNSSLILSFWFSLLAVFSRLIYSIPSSSIYTVAKLIHPVHVRQFVYYNDNLHAFRKYRHYTLTIWCWLLVISPTILASYTDDNILSSSTNPCRKIPYLWTK